MLKTPKYIFFFLLLSFPIKAFYGFGSEELKIENISIEHGLSQNTVRSILQDSRGFLWFSTEDGLNRYDGYKIKIYRHDQLDSNSLSDNFIWSVCETRNGELWIGTNSGGLNKFDREKERFVRFQNSNTNPNSISNNNIRVLYEDNSGNLWIGTEGGGLNKYNTSSKTFSRITLPVNLPGIVNIFSIAGDSKGSLWLGTDHGLLRFNTYTNKFDLFSNPESPTDVSSNIIYSLLIDLQNRMWIGSEAGVYFFNEQKASFTKYTEKVFNSGKVLNGIINAFYEDKKGNIWICSQSGLGYLIKESNEFVPLFHSSEPGTLSNNNITSIIEDRTGIIWTGTTEGGINKIDRRKNKFTHYKHNPFEENSLSYSTIRAIFQDKKGMLWIGTLEGGLNRFDRKNNKIQHYKNDPKDPSSISENTITSILQTSRNELWIGTWGGGLNRAVFLKGTDIITGFEHFKTDNRNPHSLGSNIIQALFEDSKGRLWVGTQQGLDLLDRRTNSFIHFRHDSKNASSLSNNKIQSNCIYEDRSGNIWVGTWEGLNRIKFNKDPIQHPEAVSFDHIYAHSIVQNSLSNNRILSIYEDEKRILWVGTYGGGLNKIKFRGSSKNDFTIARYTEKNGLANDIIYGILGDNEGNLWLSTNNGLSKFEVTKENFQNYYKGNGLQSNQFYWGACFKGIDGELFFGGINGFNSFFPSMLVSNKDIPAVYITDFQIFNKPVSTYSANSPLKSSLEFTKEIELDYDQYVFTFEFVALDFSNPAENKYSYKMEGFDNDWINSGKRNFATYTNLDPGEYTFRVIGSNNDGVWNDKGAFIKLIIHPPFWETWWFILIVISIIGSSIYYFMKMHINDLLAVERVRIKLAADLHDNIGASLTEISILSEIINKRLNSEDKEVAKNLKMISDNSRDLIDKMSDIVWLVNPKRDSLYDLILRLEDTYSEILSCTSISFRSHNLQTLEKISLTMEQRQNLFLTFKEAINNAITHSSCTEIFLNANVKGKLLEIELRDNGKGFSKQNSAHRGNGLDNMKNRAKNIGGELDINFTPEGTSVTFRGNIL